MSRKPRRRPERRKGLQYKPRHGTEADRIIKESDVDLAAEKKELDAKRGEIGKGPKNFKALAFDPKNVKNLWGKEGWQGPVAELDLIPKLENPFPPYFDFIPPKPPIWRPPAGNFEEHAARFNDIPSDVPLMLLPVRLETRFKGTANARELHIRVMPSDVFLSPNEMELTTAEIAAGEDFKSMVDELGADDPAVLAAWTSGVSRPDGMRFALAYHAAQKTIDVTGVEPEAQSLALTSRLLPDRWLAVGYTDGAVAFSAFSKDVDKDIAFLPDPTDPTTLESPSTDPKTFWMFDFEEAYDRGMGIKAGVVGAAADRIDEIFVLGWQDNSTSAKPKKNSSAVSAAIFESVLQDQHYAFGAGFVPQGVATNNSEAAAAGWLSTAKDAAESWQREREALDDPITPIAHVASDKVPLWPDVGLMSDSDTASNAGRMANALGLSSISTLRRFQFREGAEGTAMAAMNTALWPATYGELLGTLLDQPKDDDFFDSGLVSWVRDWFTQKVHGGGVLPALRIGERPYSVLPVQRQNMRQFGLSLVDASKQKTKQFEIFLETMLTHWVAATNDVVRLTPEDPSGTFEEPGVRLLAILQQGPHPQRFSTSYLESSETSVRNLMARHRAALTDTENSELLARAFTMDFGDVQINLADADAESDWLKWPNRFQSARQMELHIAGLRETVASILKKRRLYPFDGSGWFSFFADILQDQNQDAIEEVIALYDEVLEDIALHRSRNFVLDLLGAPTTMYNSVPAGNVDPPLSYLTHGVEEKAWSRDAIVEVDHQDDTISSATWIAYLIDYADALIAREPAPVAPDFPDDEAPLVYNLIRTGLRRVSTQKGSTTNAFAGVLEEVSWTQRKFSFSATEAFSSAELQPISGAFQNMAYTKARVQPVATASPPSAPPSGTVDNEVQAINGIGGLLLATPLQEVQILSDSLVALLKDESQPPDLPRLELAGISEGLRAYLEKPDLLLEVVKLPDLPTSRVQELREIKSALMQLKTLKKEQLELLSAQTLGVAGWRLDAWLTAIAKDRLEQLREKATTGIQIGAFGYVHGLTRAKGATSRSQGFITAPSMTHAKTAAILRSGWMAYGSEDNASPFAVDLSSERVNNARRVMDAVRQGQDMATVLGQQFEANLRENNMGAVWVLPLRRVMGARKPSDVQCTDAEITRQTVDGLDLQRATANSTERDTIIEDATNVLADLLPNGTQIAPDWIVALDKALDSLQGSVDALADSGISEAVHQLVQGNVARAGATLRALQTGDSPPPELTVLQTGTPARSQQHSLVIPLPSRANSPFETPSPSEANCPEVSGLVAALLDTQLSGLHVQWSAVGDDGKIAETGWVSWADEVSKVLELGHFDVLILTASSGLSGLTPWVEAYLLIKLGPEYFEKYAIRFDAYAGFEAVAGPAEAEAYLDAIRKMVMDARPFDLRDVPANLAKDNAPELDIDQLISRVKALRSEILAHADAVFDQIDKALFEATAPPVDHDAIKGKGLDALMFFAKLGHPDALTAWRLSQLGGIGLGRALAALIPRIKSLIQAAKSFGATPDDDTAAKLRKAKTALQTLLGQNVPVVVPVRWDNAQAYSDAFLKSQDRLAGIPNAPHVWIERQGYTDEALLQSGRAFELYDATADNALSLNVAQWPDDGTATWIGIDSDAAKDGPKRSAIHATLPKMEVSNGSEGFVCALVLADIIETIPSSEHDMAAALHVDSPNAEAPQSILLAVTRETDAGWSFDNVLGTVRTAFDLAKIRLVDGTSLSSFNQILPAIYGNAGLHEDNQFNE